MCFINAKVLIEGPESGVARQVIPIRRLTLTKFKLNILRAQRTGLLKKAIAKADLNKKWAATALGKKLAAKAKRASLTDFDRFKVMVLKKQLSHKLAHQVKTLRKGAAKKNTKAKK